ncbi:MAG: hypothetical protein ACXAEU_14655 [Candidatus Hodarchaeales archaeon]|jgi:hypothetical protein
MKRDELIKLQELVNLTSSKLSEFYMSFEVEFKETQKLFSTLEQCKNMILDGDKQIGKKFQNYEKQVEEQKVQLRKFNLRLTNVMLQSSILEMENENSRNQISSLEKKLARIELEAKELQKETIVRETTVESEISSENHNKALNEIENLSIDIEQKNALITKLLSDIKSHETILEKVFQGIKHSELLSTLRRDDSNILDLEKFFSDKNDEDRIFYERAISELEGSGLILREGNVIREKRD